MKTIYKVLISILVMSMLTSVGMASAAKPTPTPTQLPISEQIQNTRIGNLETNDTLQQINNSEQQTSIDTMKTQINNLISALNNGLTSLASRITNLENNDSTRGIYGRNAGNVHIGNEYTTITDYNLNLKKPSYVYIEGSGSVENCKAGQNTIYPFFAVAIYVDNESQYGQIFDGQGQTIWGGGYCNDELYIIPFQASDIIFLSAGNHYVSLKGLAFSSYIDIAGLNIIVDPNGGLNTQQIAISRPSTTNISNQKISIENGKATAIQ